MEISKIKEKLLMFPRPHDVFSKIRAVFSPKQALADESKPALCLTASTPFNEVKAYQLEVERMRVQAQEMAHKIRQRPA
jgi:hypothetical protein